MTSLRAVSGLAALQQVMTLGEDREGYILHQRYVQESAAEGMGAFVAFSVKEKTHPDAAGGKRHVLSLGRTYANDFAEACCVILSHPAVQTKLTQYAIDFMVVRSSEEPDVRVQVKIPEWATRNSQGR